jgi:hypothetical protein
MVYSHPDPSSSTDLFLTNSGLISRYLALKKSLFVRRRIIELEISKRFMKFSLTVATIHPTH